MTAMHDTTSDSHDDDAHEVIHEVPYGTYILVWIALLALTQFTVAAAQLHLGALGILIAVIVTPVKAVLVLFYFMHLRYEHVVFRAMFIFAVLSLLAGIGFTFLDYSFRQ